MLKWGVLGSPPFWASEGKTRIKTLQPLESQCSGFFNGANIIFLILHFDAQNGEPKFSNFHGANLISTVDTRSFNKIEKKKSSILDIFIFFNLSSVMVANYLHDIRISYLQ